MSPYNEGLEPKNGLIITPDWGLGRLTPVGVLMHNQSSLIKRDFLFESLCSLFDSVYLLRNYL